MAAGGGFKWLTQNVFHNRLHILNHMSIHWSRKTFVYACARAFLWLCVKASENVCRARVSGNHWWLCLLSYQTNHTHFPSRPSFQAEHSKPTVTAPLHSVGCSLNTSWPCDSLQLPFDWMLRGGRMKRRGGGGAEGRHGAGWQRTHERKQIPAPLPWRWVNSESGGSWLWGTGWPAVVNNSSPYPAPKWLGKHRVKRAPRGWERGITLGWHADRHTLVGRGLTSWKKEQGIVGTIGEEEGGGEWWDVREGLSTLSTISYSHSHKTVLMAVALQSHVTNYLC